jgi:hypothetical protein
MKILGNGFDQKFRNDLNDNFSELNASKNLDGKQFASLNDRLNAIESGLKSLGVSINGDIEL